MVVSSEEVTMNNYSDIGDLIKFDCERSAFVASLHT